MRGQVLFQFVCFSLDSFSILRILFGYFHPYRIRQFPEEALSLILLFYVLVDDIMILPTIVRSTQESLLSVQGGLREGAYALGTSKVRTIFKIVLPSAVGGIVTAVILAIGRVVSESAVLLLTINMVVNKVPENLMSPGTSLALDIYYFASHGYPDEAAATAVVLLVFVMILNLLAGFIGNLIRKSTYGDAK